jgi:hypothetical protein
MTKPIALPPIEQLNELFEIVPIPKSQIGTHSGLVWKIKRNGTKGIGSVAGNKRPSSITPGRFDWVVYVDGRYYTTSRVIYLMANGVDPGEFQVDHEDQNPLNNNVWNLRLLTSSPQCHNKKPRIDNKSGAVGVSQRKNGKWQAELVDKGKHFYLGTHTCLIEAARVVNDKILELGLDKIGKPLIDLESLERGCSNSEHAPTA